MLTKSSPPSILVQLVKLAMLPMCTKPKESAEFPVVPLHTAQ